MTINDPDLSPPVRAALCDALIVSTLRIDPVARPDLLDMGRQACEAAAQAWKPERGAFSTYAVQALCRLPREGIARKYARRIDRTETLHEALAVTADRDPSAALDTLAAIDRLPAGERRLIQRYMAAGQNAAQLAREDGISHTLIIRRLSRPLGRLRKALVAYA